MRTMKSLSLAMCGLLGTISVPALAQDANPTDAAPETTQAAEQQPAAQPPAGQQPPPPPQAAPPPPAGYQPPPSGYPQPPGAYQPPPQNVPNIQPAPAYAQPGDPAYGQPYAYDYMNPGRHQHDGFFLRLNLGPSYMVSSFEDVQGDPDMYGFGMMFNLSIGGAVMENLIIHGDLYTTSAIDPEIGYEGAPDVDADGLLSNTALGAGITYYLMPANVFFTFGLALSTLDFEADDDDFDDSETYYGTAMRFMFGKEWWVSDDWGLGVAGQLMFSRTWADDDVYDDAAANTFAAGILFSATYN